MSKCWQVKKGNAFVWLELKGIGLKIGTFAVNWLIGSWNTWRFFPELYSCLFIGYIHHGNMHRNANKCTTYVGNFLKASLWLSEVLETFSSLKWLVHLSSCILCLECLKEVAIHPVTTL